MEKVYVIDTNVLLSDPESVFSFQDNDLVIPMVMLEELDEQKTRQDEIGKNARKINRTLDELRKLGSLKAGVRLPTGGVLQVRAISPNYREALPFEIQNNLSKVDNQLIALALEITTECQVNNAKTCILVSRDINVRVKCDAVGVRSEDYLKVRVKPEKEDELYTGVETLHVSSQTIDEFYDGRPVYVSTSNLDSLHSNQFLILRDELDESKSALARFESYDKQLRKLNDLNDAFGLVPRNKEQKFALDLLYDPDIKLVTLLGPAGCGKSLLAVAAGVDQTRGNRRKYDKLIISRPVQPLGKDIGFLPGTLEEKMEPWIVPLKDSLNFLFGSKKNRNASGEKSGRRSVKDDEYLSIEIEKGHIEIEALTYIRGRSIPNAFILIDEVQNISLHELKTIVTRVGEGTKLILTGDVEQIDNLHVDTYSNGLSCAVEKFKDHSIAGHVTLYKGERSALATIASKIL